MLILPSLEHVWAWFGSYHLVWSRTKKRVITLLIPRNHAHYRDIQRIHMNSKLSSAISDCLYDLLHYVSMSNELEKKTRDYGFAPTTVSFFLAQWTKITRRCIFNTAISNWTLGVVVYIWSTKRSLCFVLWSINKLKVGLSRQKFLIVRDLSPKFSTCT